MNNWFKIQKIKRLLYEHSMINSVSLQNLIKLGFSLFKDSRALSGFSRSLINVTLELTHRCNISCWFCFLRSSHKIQQQDEMSTEQIKDFINSISNYKVGFYITGGEPFLRDDCIDLISYIKSKKIKCGLNTNGTILDLAEIKKIVNSKMDYIIFSLHGLKENHERICGDITVYSAVYRNIAAFVKARRNTKVIIHCVICPDNIDTLVDVYNLANELKVDGVIFRHMQLEHGYPNRSQYANYKGLENSLNIMSEEKLNILKDKLVHLKMCAANYKTKISIRPDLSFADMVEWYGGRYSSDGRCFYPWTDMRILPNGDMVSCQPLSIKVGNILNEPWQVLWNNDKFLKFRISLTNKNTKYSGCSTCCKSYRAF